MSQKILQIRFRTTLPRAEYEQLSRSLARDFPDVPGMLWKIWTYDEWGEAASGIYLFADEASLQRYLRSPMLKRLRTDPHFRIVQVWHQDVLAEPTMATGGPILRAAAA
jgi:hypothetical protein